MDRTQQYEVVERGARQLPPIVQNGGKGPVDVPEAKLVCQRVPDAVLALDGIAGLRQEDQRRAVRVGSPAFVARPEGAEEEVPPPRAVLPHRAIEQKWIYELDQQFSLVVL